MTVKVTVRRPDGSCELSVGGAADRFAHARRIAAEHPDYDVEAHQIGRVLPFDPAARGRELHRAAELLCTTADQWETKAPDLDSVQQCQEIAEGLRRMAAHLKALADKSDEFRIKAQRMVDATLSDLARVELPEAARAPQCS